MKSKHISDALEGIDFDMVEDAGQPFYPQKSRGPLLRWAVIAACLALILGSLGIMLSLMQKGDTPIPSITEDTEVFEENQSSDIGASVPTPPAETIPAESLPAESLPEDDHTLWVDERPRNDKQGATGENAIEWPWYCLEIWEQYVYIQYEGVTYRMGSASVNGNIIGLSPQTIGEKLADGEAYGYEYSTASDREPVKRTVKCEVYTIKGIPEDRYIAIKYSNHEGYFKMFADAYNPPATLGELISQLDLTNNCILDTVNDYSKRQFESFGLTKESSDTLWSMFLKYADTAVQAESAAQWSKKRISFSLTSEALGIYNLSWSLRENGWLVTNVEGYGYYYYLGPDAAAEIMAYTLAHKTELQKETTYHLVGVITEIGEDYIKIDDSIMMENPEDGIVFTVYAGNTNIKKYLACGYLSVGREVMVSHKGIYTNEPTVVRTATVLHEVWIGDSGDVWIPE